jgi:hypothetical protein
MNGERIKCPKCNREVSKTKAGETRMHRDRYGDPCPGTHYRDPQTRDRRDQAHETGHGSGRPKLTIVPDETEDRMTELQARNKLCTAISELDKALASGADHETCNILRLAICQALIGVAESIDASAAAADLREVFDEAAKS